MIFGLLSSLLLYFAQTEAEGRAEAEGTEYARRRLPNVSGYYRKKKGRQVEPGAFDFKVILLRPNRPTRLVLDDHVEDLTWTDEAAQLTGTLTLRRPDPDRPRLIPILAGNRIKVRAGYRDRWYDLWTMRCAPPQTDLGDGTMTVELSDDLDKLRRNKRDWSFRKTKKRGRGFFAHEIARQVLKKEGVEIRRLAKGKKEIKKLVEKNTAGLDIIREAYKREREETGIRYVMRMVDGEFEVVPYRRNRILYVFKDEITGAMLNAEQKAHPVTVIDARGKVGKGKDAEKIKRRIFRRAMVRRFGWVVKETNYGRLDSPEQMRRKAMRDLAEEIRPNRTADLSLPGVPFIRRGDGARWVNREPGWYGKEVDHSRDRTFIYVKTITHSVSSAGYTMDLSVVQDDPYLEDRERMDEEAREKAREERERREEEEDEDEDED
jgi:hypothetical protein